MTPDSFSDGGKYLTPDAAVRHGLELVGEGADVLDIGGESTRPGAAAVPEEEELRRVLPVVEALAGRVSVPLSIDTRKPAVARAALAAGASIVNDVEACRATPEMWEAVAGAGAGYVCMHMQGSPETMQREPRYADVVREVADFFADRLVRLAAAGVGTDQVALDVGIGFGKTVEHNLRLLAALESFRSFTRPLVLGVSRKSFIGRMLDAESPGARLPGALACTLWAAERGAGIVRTHDVAATRQALQMAEALRQRTAC